MKTELLGRAIRDASQHMFGGQRPAKFEIHHRPHSEEKIPLWREQLGLHQSTYATTVDIDTADKLLRFWHGEKQHPNDHRLFEAEMVNIFTNPAHGYVPILSNDPDRTNVAKQKIEQDIHKMVELRSSEIDGVQEDNLHTEFTRIMQASDVSERLLFVRLLGVGDFKVTSKTHTDSGVLTDPQFTLTPRNKRDPRGTITYRILSHDVDRIQSGEGNYFDVGWSTRFSYTVDPTNKKRANIYFDLAPGPVTAAELQAIAAGIT